MKRKNRSDRDGGDEGNRENQRGFSKLDEETLKYYTEIDAHFKTLDDNEEKQLLADNVLSETEGREADIVPDAACSRVIESILPFASPSSLGKFTENCIQGENLGIICTSGPFGSHVLEKLLTALSSLALSAPDDDTHAIAEKSLTSFTEACTDSLYDMITSKYGSFVARRLLCILCGKDVSKPPPSRNQLPTNTDSDQQGITQLSKSNRDGLHARITNASSSAHDNNQRSTLSSYTNTELLYSIVNTVMSDEWTGHELVTVQNDQFAGPFLQSLLRALTVVITATNNTNNNTSSKHDWSAITSKLIVHLLGGTVALGIDSVTPDTLLRLMTDRNGSHLMEAIFESAPDETLHKLCTAAFRGRLPAMAQHPSANFAVQAVLASLRKPQQLKRMFEDLRPHFAALLRGRRAGVVTLLLAAARRLSCLESDCSSALWHALQSGFSKHNDDDNSDDKVTVTQWTPLHTLLTLDTTITTLTTSSSTSNNNMKNPRLSSLGCVALVTIFSYPSDYIKQWTTAMFDLTPAEAATIASDPGGCRVIETYLRGPGGATKRKRKIMQSLAGHWATIAMSGAGARFIESCVAVADVEEQEQIASELAAAEKRISALPWGSVLMRRCHVDVYMSSKRSGGKDGWKEKVEKAATTRKEFEELFGDDDGDRDGDDDEGVVVNDEDDNNNGDKEEDDDHEKKKKRKKKEKKNKGEKKKKKKDS